MQLASGDIIGFVHSDDFLNSMILYITVSMTKSENLDGVYGDLQYVDKSNTKKLYEVGKVVILNPVCLNKDGCHPIQLYFKKEVYQKHGLFDLSYTISADYDFILRIFKDPELKFGYLPKVITKMRVGGASNKSLKNIIKKSKEDYRAIRINNIGNFLTLARKNFSKIKKLF